MPDDLRADCARCFALCCVAPAFARSADFAINKPAGQPCPNLGAGFRCGIHTELRPRGFPGCTVFDCFGAGQQVAQVTYQGRDWRQAPKTGPEMFEVFGIMYVLHQLLWYLAEARTAEAAGELHPRLAEAQAELERHTRAKPGELRKLDLLTLRDRVGDLLLQTSELVRKDGPDHRRADLVGASLRRADLRGANLRGALLIGADLRSADLRTADVIGADFRGADLRGADLTGALFLVQSQLEAAKGDATTRIPSAVAYPAHWGV
ncbi:pentapeptide repeat-containing protein [Acrocarpospora catenulata]|uniref:pentapeptide repeat-containing protein n=1 Tax=Acrocarpospora catenulata TaxID=2836182 RepID=UPI001BDB6127|nr:pentapeptide repeat-containing protein [Acrocarpospora catenulata]